MLSEGTSLSYALEYTRQSDYEDGSNIGADYWLAELGRTGGAAVPWRGCPRAGQRTLYQGRPAADRRAGVSAGVVGGRLTGENQSGRAARPDCGLAPGLQPVRRAPGAARQGRRFYQRQEERNAAKLERNPDAEIKWRKYTGKPTFYDQIGTSLLTVFTGFVLASLIAIPFGALDALTRAHLQDSVMEIQADLNNTVIMVIHDVDEAVLLSDKIVMMTNGPAATVG